MKMGNHICMPLFNSKEKSRSVMPVTSICNIEVPANNSTAIFRELNLVPTSSPTSQRTEITSTGVNFRSMEDLHAEVNRRLMMLQQRH
uniref:Cell cycle regulator n=1 Tax=Beet curly top virus TaxID=10840 RepID=A0A125R9Q6_9GEMI|nr:cell cycle regulator [Beet curly top virus]AMD16466.1 cell cycle regulator [Beet curly top virus]WGU24634.1 C4 [Beet curly top virus]